MVPSRLTFKDLKTRVARYLRKVVVASDGVSPPTDVGTNAMIEDAINAGLAQLAIDHQWSWLTQRVTVTLSADGTAPQCINGDPTQYRMRADLEDGTPVGQVQYVADNVRSPVDVKTDDFVERMNLDSSLGGPVCLASFRPSIVDGSDDGNGTAWVMRVHPKPSASGGTIIGRFGVNMPTMKEDAQVGIWPPYMDIVVEQAAVAKLAELGMLPEGMVAQTAMPRYAASLAAAIDKDNQIGYPRDDGQSYESDYDDETPGLSPIMDGVLIT